MKIFSRITLTSVVLVSLFSLSSCMQYPEGPFFTLQTRDERLDGTWLVTHVTDVSGNDVSSEFINYTLTVVANRSGESDWSEFQDEILVSAGTYQFADHSDYIIVLFTYLKGVETYSQKFNTIRKLTDKKFEFVDDAGYDYELEKY